MRNQFFADAKDYWKWTIAKEFAKEDRDHLLWIAMMRPDDPADPHGNGAQNSGFGKYLDSKVVEFLDNKRESFKFNSGVAPDRPELRMCNDMREADFGFNIELILDEYEPACSNNKFDKGQAYFEKYVSNRIEALSNREIVVLIDPDNGVSETTSMGNKNRRAKRNKQVHPEFITNVLNAITTNSVIIIYWEPSRESSVDSCTQLLEKACKIKSAVQFRGFPWEPKSASGFYVILKP